MEPTPRQSRSSSSSSASRNSRGLTLDLSDLPMLSQPTPPSNTLLFTQLDNLDIFRPENLETIRGLVAAIAPIHAFAPLRSFRRILISFFDISGAKAVRAAWDGESIMGDRIRVYFGNETPIHARDEHLALPDAGRLFFISPPPSPPQGWEMRLEDAPNKQVHAEDLADALARLHHSKPANAETDAAIAAINGPTKAGLGLDSPISPIERSNSGMSATSAGRGGRSRSSTLIWQPKDHGSSPALPAVFVEDMTDEPEAMSPLESSKPIMAHTARPPVELMHDA
jgi:hypothetical protein